MRGRLANLPIKRPARGLSGWTGRAGDNQNPLNHYTIPPDGLYSPTG